MEKKQTAVQWLETTISSMIDDSGYLVEDYPLIMGHIKKALQIEREQIEEAYNEGSCHGVDVGCGRRPESKNGEQYYTQIF